MAFPRASRDEASRFSGARRLGRAEARIVRTGNTPRALRGFRLAHAWRRTCEKSRAVRHEKVPLHLVPFRGERGREVHAADPAQGHAEPARAGLVLGHGLVVLVLLGEVRLVHLGGLHDRRQARRTGEDGARQEQVVGFGERDVVENVLHGGVSRADAGVPRREEASFHARVVVSWLVARARAGLGPLETVVVAFLSWRTRGRGHELNDQGFPQVPG